MAKSWSDMRKKLEQDLLCESLRGRVQYFLTHYHGAPDEYGRFCVRVDGKEVFHANPYNESHRDRIEEQLREERQVPCRSWNGKSMDYVAENEELEKEAAQIVMNEGVMEDYQVLHAIEEFCQTGIQDSLRSENPVIRMMAILDRRTGKRSLALLKQDMNRQPEWLKFFLHLRLQAEGLEAKEI